MIKELPKTTPVLPRHRVWLCFDLDNKDGQRYVWWFCTRAEALAHKAQQRRNNGARLSYPQRYKKER